MSEHFVYADNQLIGTVDTDALEEIERLEGLRGIMIVPACSPVRRNDGLAKRERTRIARRLEHAPMVQQELF